MSRIYSGDHTDHVAFPLGGIGAGMFCLEGRGALSHFSLRNRPDVFHEPCVFSAIFVRGETSVARVIEGQVPRWKAYGAPNAANGIGGRAYGLPRFRTASFHSEFPFGKIQLDDPALPLKVEVNGWSPFIPGDPDSSSLPVAALEYTFTNSTDKPIEAVYSFHARNFMAIGREGSQVLAAPGGFVLDQVGSDEKPWDKGSCCVAIHEPGAVANLRWFRGDWFDPLTVAWNEIEAGETPSNPAVTEGRPSPGGSVFLPFSLPAGGSRTVRVQIAWYVPESDLSIGPEDAGVAKPRYQPWYAGRFADVLEVAAHWQQNYDALRAKTEAFTRSFFDTTLPADVVESVEANLAIIKSPTVLRQKDGRLWCWEGCDDGCGCCSGSCTHVWNYAQAIPHLFPSLERSLRQTEFNESQDDRGHQTFRSALPIRPLKHDFHAAADGQLGGIIKVYREWRVAGDSGWLRALWPNVRKSLDYCISTWDPDGEGVVKEPHHNTYDIEFWGPDGMCTSFYLGALKAASLMGKGLGDDVSLYDGLLEKGLRYMDERLFNGEYYIQNMEWSHLRAGDPAEFGSQTYAGQYSPEAVELLQKEGPKYQYGNGCLTDGVLGYWLAEVCGIDDFANVAHIASHLSSIRRYNLKKDLSAHVNPQRPTFALGDEGGVLLCTWPHGDKLSLPFVYSDEVWTGIEHQAASHMLLKGLVQEGLDVLKEIRGRYDGKKRNPFDEYECGHWYARAMASYGLLVGITGARYDAVDKVLHLRPRIKGDFRSFLCTATGFGTVGVRDGKPFLEVASGEIPYSKIDYTPA